MKQWTKTTILTIMAGSFLMAGGHIKPTPAPLLSKDKLYVGAGIALSNTQTFIYSKENVFDGVVRIGYDFTDYIGIESRGIIGINKGDYLRHAYSYGLYLKLQYPISDQFKVYGLIGYARTRVNLDKTTAHRRHVKAHTTQDDISGGIGIEYDIDNHWSIYADALRMVNKSTSRIEGQYSEKVNTFSVGVLYHF